MSATMWRRVAMSRSKKSSHAAYAHRYIRDGLIVDVLAPDGIKRPATLDGSLKAVGVPGGSQALARAETVAVRIGDHERASQWTTPLNRLGRPRLRVAARVREWLLRGRTDPRPLTRPAGRWLA
jgi:hypothetical protein